MEKGIKIYSTGLTNSLASLSREEEKIIKMAVTTSIARVVGVANVDKNESKLIYSSLLEKFPNTPLIHIENALKKGSTGDYGKSYRINAQEMCMWVNEYLKTAMFLNVDDFFFRDKGMTIEEFCDKENEKLVEQWLEREGYTDKNMAIEFLEYNDKFYTPDNVRKGVSIRFEQLKNK